MIYSTATIISRIRGAIAQALRSVFPAFGENTDVTKTFEGAVGVANGAEIRLLQKYGEQATREACPLTASSKEKNDLGQLENWGIAILGRVPFRATEGKYKITLTGSGIVRAGAVFTNTETNLVYLLTADATAPTATAEVQSSGAGVEVALEVGDTLTMDIEVAGVGSEADVNTIVTAPTDKETDAEYLDAIVTALRNKPRGGGKGDYRDWCLGIDGLHKVYPYSGEYLGDMKVYVQATKTQANPDGAPGSALIAEVLAKIEDPLTGQPETAGDLLVLAMLKLGTTVVVYGLSDSSLEGDIEDVIDEYVYGLEPFISGVDLDTDRNDKLSKGGLMAAIVAQIAPATITDLTIFVNGIQRNNWELPEGTVLYMAGVTFSA